MPWSTEPRPYRGDSLLTTVSLESPRRRKLPPHAKPPMAKVIVQLNGARIIAPRPRRRMRRDLMDMDDVGPPPQHYAKEENAQEADIDEHRRKRCKRGPCEVAIPPIKRRAVQNKKRSRPQSLTTRTRKAFLKQVSSIPVACQSEYRLLGFPFVFPNTIPTGPVQQAVVEPPVVQIAPPMCHSSADAVTHVYPLTQQPSSVQPKTKHVVTDPLFNIHIPRSIVVATLVKERLPLRVRKDARPLANAVPYRQSWKSKRPEHYKPVQRSVPLVIPGDLRERLAAVRVMWDVAPTQEEPALARFGITVSEGEVMEVDDEDVDMYFTPSSSMDDVADEMEIWISPVKPMYHTRGTLPDHEEYKAESLPRSAQDGHVAMDGGNEVWYDASDAGFPEPVPAPPATPNSSARQSDLLAAAENFLASLDVPLAMLRAQRPSMPVPHHGTMRSVPPSPVRPTAALFAELFSAFSTLSHKDFAGAAQGSSDPVSPGLVTQTPLLDDVFGPSPALPQLITPHKSQFVALTEEQECDKFFMRGSGRDIAGAFQQYRDVPEPFSEDEDD